MRALLIFLSLCIASMTYAQAEKQGGKQTLPAQPSSHDACPNQGPPPCSPATIIVAPSQAVNTTPNKKADGIDEKSEWEKWTAIGTGMLAIGTLGLAGIALWQRFDLKETAERQLRAYVSIRPDRSLAKVTLEDMHTTGFRFLIVNDGKTPAYNVRHEIAIGGWIDEPEFKDTEFPDNGSKFVLNPDAISEINISRKTAFSDTEKALIRDKKLKIYIWGEIRYLDAFNKPRWTKFRWRQDGNALHWTEEGNEAS